MSQEIESQNIVYMKRLRYNDPNLFPYIFKFIDENKDIKKFSELLKSEIKYVFVQKKRINLVADEVGKIFAAYDSNEFFGKN